jgi:microcystin-dependent protein
MTYPYPIGSIIARARNDNNSSASTTWAAYFLLCDGSTYLKDDYIDLYQSFQTDDINTSTNGYGIISDTDTFQVPDLRGCTPCMNTSTELGITSGNSTQTLDKYLLPSHNHSFSLTSNSHSHEFIYKGCNDGFNRTPEIVQVEQSDVQYSPIVTTKTYSEIATRPTGLGDVTDETIEAEVSYTQKITQEEQEINIINNYVGIDYYININNGSL